MDKPTRKPNRLPNFDYSSPNVYFVTICTVNRRNLFWNSVGATSGRPCDDELTELGKIADKAIKSIPKHYPALLAEHYVVMPNHVHILLRICADAFGRPVVAPTISRVVKQFKGVVSKQSGQEVWQKGFHDHVVRTQDEYQRIWQYIDENPLKWENDRFFLPE